jgi:hypothetical protein
MPLKSDKVLKTIQKYETKQEIKQLKQQHKKLKKLLFMSVEINNKYLQDLFIDNLENLDLKLNELSLKMKLL